MHKPEFIEKIGQLMNRHGMPFRRAIGLEAELYRQTHEKQGLALFLPCDLTVANMRRGDSSMKMRNWLHCEMGAHML
jgi:uncharacterized protein YoaH (UPF0181 family)